MVKRKPLELSKAEISALTVLARRDNGLTENAWAAFGVKPATVKSLLKKRMVVADGDRDQPTFKITMGGRDALPL